MVAIITKSNNNLPSDVAIVELSVFIVAVGDVVDAAIGMEVTDGDVDLILVVVECMEDSVMPAIVSLV